MRRLVAAQAVLAIATAIAPAVASAALPEWSTPTPLASATGGGDIGIDGSGAITAVWTGRGARGTFVATRAPGARRFEPAGALDRGRSHSPRLSVGGSGGAVAVWRHDDVATCRDLGCRSTLRVSLRRAGGELGPARELPASDDAAFFDAVVAGDEAIVAWSARGGGLRIARGPLGRGLGAPQRLAANVADSFSLAANERGDAVIAWAAGNPDAGGLAVMASLRPAGGRFGAAERVLEADPTTSHHPGVDAAIDGGGRATLALSTRGRRVSVARRAAGSGWRIAKLGSGFSGQVAARADGDLMAWWHRPVHEEGAFPPRYETDVALAAPGRPFGQPHALPVGSGAPVRGGFDSLSNAVFVSAGPPPSQRLVAGTIDRFGVAAVRELNDEPSHPLELEVNGSGAAVALATVFRSGGADLVVADRRADASRPRVATSGARATPRVFDARVRCDEPCRVRVAGRGRPARVAARSRVRRAQVLQGGRRARVRVAIPARERRRIRRALRGRRGARVRLVLRVEDAAGNRRAVRRRVAVRRGLPRAVRRR